MQQLNSSSQIEYLLTEKNQEGESVLDLIAVQGNQQLLMLEPVQNLVLNLWEGPFEIDGACAKYSKTSAIVHSFTVNGASVDMERVLRWQKFKEHPQNWLSFEVWKQGFKTRYFLEALFVVVLTLLLQDQGTKAV